MGDYQFGTFSGHHRFCKQCGVHAFGEGELEVLGGKYYSVNIACLDVDHEILAAAPVRFMSASTSNKRPSTIT